MVVPLSVRSVAVSAGRTLALRLSGGIGTQVRVSIKRGGRCVSKSAFRTVTGSTLRLTLDRKLARGSYTVKVIAMRDQKQTVLLAKLKV